MPWPDTNEFANFLVGAGLRDSPPTVAQKALDLQGALDTAVEKWNGLTHYWPFLSTGVDETRLFGPPTGRLLDLNGGLIAFTSLHTQMVWESNNSLSAGTSRDIYRKFMLKPIDAPQSSKPWTYIEAGCWYSGVLGSIGVTGKWGYCLDADLPASARRGVMALAAIELLPQIQLQMSRGGLKKLQQGDSTKEWDFSAQGGILQGIADKALKDGQFVRRRIA